MARQTHYLQLQPEESAARIIERLATLPRGARALFILPPDAPPFQNRLDLTLALRAASRRAIRIALVSQDPQVLHQAAALNISAFATVGAAEGRRWKRGRTRAFGSKARREARPDAETELPARPASAAALPRPVFARARLALLRMLATIALLALPVAAAAFFLPSAQLTLQPQLSTIEQEISLRAQPALSAIDFEAAAIPVIPFQVTLERSGRQPSSGSTIRPHSLATGVITFTNLTTRELQIPAGTSLSSAGDAAQHFRTTEAARVPAGYGETARAPIEAQQSSAGKRGNLPAGAIQIIDAAFAERVRVVNTEATGGGQDDEYAIVTEADRRELRARLEREMLAAAYQEMLARREPGQTILLQTLRLSLDEERAQPVRYSAAAGEVAPEFTLTLSAVVSAYAYRQSDIQQVALARLSAARPAGALFLPERTRLECCEVDAVYEDDSIALNLRARGQFLPELPLAEYRARLAGRSASDARAWLADHAPLASGTTPELVISPAWFGRLPFWAERIAIDTALPELP